MASSDSAASPPLARPASALGTPGPAPQARTPVAGGQRGPAGSELGGRSSRGASSDAELASGGAAQDPELAPHWRTLAERQRGGEPA